MRKWSEMVGAMMIVAAMVGCGGGDDDGPVSGADAGTRDAAVGTDSSVGVDATVGVDAGDEEEVDASTGGSDAGTDAGEEPGVSFETQIYPLLMTRCSGCHGTSGGLTLGPNADAAHAELVGPNRTRAGGCDAPTELVTPGDAEASFLIYKLTQPDSAACGFRMPRGGSLEEAQIDLISQWIEEGALNN